ncbi:MAG: hypothetical protein ACW986_14355 [Promethearchaeota archaeon]|jgi:uncharacterized protein with PIN domain
MDEFKEKRFIERISTVKCEFCGYIISKPFPKNSLCPKCGKFLADLFDLSVTPAVHERITPINRCENCGTFILFEYPQIDEEKFQLCPKCFKILSKVVRDIENIFDDDEEFND